MEGARILTEKFDVEHYTARNMVRKVLAVIHSGDHFSEGLDLAVKSAECKDDFV